MSLLISSHHNFGNVYSRPIAYLNRPGCRLFVGVRDERAAFALTALVAQHGAFFDAALRAKHLPDVLFGEFFVQHAHEEFALCRCGKNR